MIELIVILLALVAIMIVSLIAMWNVLSAKNKIINNMVATDEAEIKAMEAIDEQISKEDKMMEVTVDEINNRNYFPD